MGNVIFFVLNSRLILSSLVEQGRDLEQEKKTWNIRKLLLRRQRIKAFCEAGRDLYVITKVMDIHFRITKQIIDKTISKSRIT